MAEVTSIQPGGSPQQTYLRAPRAVRRAPCAVRLAPCALRPAPCALRLAPCVLCLAPCASPAPCALRLVCAVLGRRLLGRAPPATALSRGLLNGRLLLLQRLLSRGPLNGRLSSCSCSSAAGLLMAGSPPATAPQMWAPQWQALLQGRAFLASVNG